MNLSATYCGLAVVGLLALAGCGAVPAPGGAPTTFGSGTVAPPSATSHAGPAPKGVLPTPAPLPTSVVPAPAPQRFVTRAGEVAAAVRSAGLPTPPGKNVLLSGWAPGLGFDTAAQKEAWGAGKVTVPPGVPADAAGTATMHLADGSSRSVDVIGPRAALARALEVSDATCADLPAVDCSLTLTGATLTSAEVSTSAGPATVPVWSFRAEGLSHPIEVVAVAPGVLVPRTDPTSPTGLAQAGPTLDPADSLVGVDGATITIRIGHGACDGELQAHVVEFDDLIVVGGTHTPPPAGTACPAIYLSTPSALTLTKPLGDRVVIDVVTGQPRFIGMG